MSEWTDEQKELRKSLEQYFERLSDGHIEDDANSVFPREKWDLIRETGVIGLPFDPEWGGLGQDALTMVYVLEHLGYGCRDQRAALQRSRPRSSAWRSRSSASAQTS